MRREKMSELYNHKVVEKKWQKVWDDNKAFAATDDYSKPKYYALVEFPYPSGQGLHVGHPRPYTALDIVARKRRMQGYNVLYPMGWDAFGLPTENYAIKNKIHPKIVTENNVKRFKEQLHSLGYSFDWDREINTTDPSYYKWTQWIFLKLFKAGLAYKKEMPINWCTSCKVGLANEEVVNGVCERCGAPVVRKVKSEWMLKITDYAEKLIEGLDHVDYIERVKVSQKNWIGKSQGAEVDFSIKGKEDKLRVYTTRCDTLFGVTYMVVSPEHPIIDKYKDELKNWDAIAAYRDEAAKKSDFERAELAKEKTGVQIEGLTAINPVNGKEIPIWISDYVLMSYGTGAIMAVPAHDERDWEFAKKFNLPLIQVVAKNGEEVDINAAAFTDVATGVLINSDFLNGLEVKDAKAKMIAFLEEKKIGTAKTNYKLRDWVFSRQRYWGEPFPVYYKDGMPYMIDEASLPLELPEVAKFLPTETGEPPLGHATKWAWDTVNKCVVENEKIDHVTVFPLELNTMPGFAGSSAYYLRYMDPHNNKALVDPKIDQYWKNVDLYVGGTEHATGHLIYSRFWNKFLYDMDVSVMEEPFQKLVNQGMIQGRSNFVYRIKDTNTFVSLNLKDQYEVTPIHVDVNIVSNDILDLEAFKAWRPEYKTAEFILEDGKYVCGWAVEKMSKSMFNVVNPDMIVEKYGADTLRMYEMFLGPVEQSKPWDTNGIDGVHRFIRKFWSLFYSRTDEYLVTDEPATKEELKSLHKLIKKVTGDIEQFSYNTSISAFMICVNELFNLKCSKKEILEQLVITLAPFAPHVCEELWDVLGHETSVCDAQWPAYNEEYLKENTVNYTISFNGKARFNMEFAADEASDVIQAAVLADERSQKWIDGKTPKKIIVVPKKIVNVVI